MFTSSPVSTLTHTLLVKESERIVIVIVYTMYNGIICTEDGNMTSEEQAFICQSGQIYNYIVTGQRKLPKEKKKKLENCL